MVKGGETSLWARPSAFIPHHDRVPQKNEEMTIHSPSTPTAMTRHSILPSLVLALAFSVPCLNAEAKRPATAPNNTSNQTAPGDASTLDKKSRDKLKRAYHLAEKSANAEFLRSPEGIGFKNLLASTDQEVNAVYEKYLNICRESPATEKGKALRAERDQQIRLLEQRKTKAEADFEALKKTSPTYRYMLEKHQMSELKQVKGKLKTQSPEQKKDGNK